MAGSDGSSSGADQPPSKFDVKTIAINISIKIPRRKVTLITITLLLNVLLWSSLICLVVSIYQVATDPKDTTNIAPVVLTSISALVTIAYTFLHTIISLKQRIWTHQRRHPSAIKKTDYVAIRMVISLCVLWLLTSGWNMIIVARRPMCLPEAPGLQKWEFGTTCQISRIGMAFAMIALIASCTLFGVLGAVRRPFEAHLFKHGYQPPVDLYATPSVSRNTSPVRPVFYASEKRHRGRQRSASTRRSSPDNFSNTDVDTLDLNRSRPPSTIHAPAPVRSIGLGIFTSSFTPPPIPSVYAAPPRTSSLETPPLVFQPSISHQSLPRQSRMSSLVAPSGFVPLSIPAQYSASAWRAVHPTSSPPVIHPASRSSPHLPSVGFQYRNRYSRSSVSLTRPHRLSSATPAHSVAWSSRSGSTGPEGRDSPMSGDDPTASAYEISNAILSGTPIPGTTLAKIHKSGHTRTISAPDATSGAQDSGAVDRMAIGWKPQLVSRQSQGQVQSQVQQHQEQDRQQQQASPDTQSVPIKLVKLIQSSSADFLSRFSPDTSPDDDKKRPHEELERELNPRRASAGAVPFPRSRSADHSQMRHASNPAEAAASMLRQMPLDLRMQKGRDVSSGGEEGGMRGMTFEEVKNKPLPKIAVL
ncbi:Nn.00g082680.m01.CDS01 [Neocucurbitaria sp. VM-36]